MIKGLEPYIRSQPYIEVLLARVELADNHQILSLIALPVCVQEQILN